ncbi:MAG: putative DNA-binding domain-containing protein [Legionellales bacterium]|nr:putative DNA-binding domain-containing protein [Legionellales bacterium]
MSNHDLLEFQKIQQAFTQSIRNPNLPLNIENVSSQRLQIYREFVFHNLCEVMENCYPVLRSLYTEKNWEVLIQDYLQQHQAQSPYFHEIGQEFLSYLQSERDLSQDPPFLLELAHYEWCEVQLRKTPNTIAELSFNPAGDLLLQKPLLSPLAWLLQYDFPVQKINRDYQPQQKPAEPTYIIIYRKISGQAIYFYEINAITARFIQLIEESELSALECLDIIASELNLASTESLIPFAREILIELKNQEIILGSQD